MIVLHYSQVIVQCKPTPACCTVLTVLSKLLGGGGRIQANTGKVTSDMYTWSAHATYFIHYCNVRKTSRVSAFFTASSNTGCGTEAFGNCLVNPKRQNTTRLKVLIILICINMTGMTWAAELFTKIDSLSTPPVVLIWICCICIYGIVVHWGPSLSLCM